MENNVRSKPVLVTGCAGFIGFHLCRRLLHAGINIVGLDNFNTYYDTALKHSRSAILEASAGFTLAKADLTCAGTLAGVLEKWRPTVIVNLAAQAGVRYSIENPKAYIDSNIVGFFNVLEACRSFPVSHLIYASSSSVYGNSQKAPFAEDAAADCPQSLYAATKKAGELMAYSYSKLYNIPATGLRFFTVYGPYGRPDMAYFSFTKKILAGQKIQIFNNGDMYRDFTYIDDITEGIARMLYAAPKPDAFGARHKVYNIGNSSPQRISYFVQLLEELLGVTAEKQYLPMQPGDVYKTCADIKALAADFGFRPHTPLSEGLSRFVTWYREYYSEEGKK